MKKETRGRKALPTKEKKTTIIHNGQAKIC